MLLYKNVSNTCSNTGELLNHPYVNMRLAKQFRPLHCCEKLLFASCTSTSVQSSIFISHVTELLVVFGLTNVIYQCMVLPPAGEKTHLSVLIRRLTQHIFRHDLPYHSSKHSFNVQIAPSILCHSCSFLLCLFVALSPECTDIWLLNSAVSSKKTHIS